MNINDIYIGNPIQQTKVVSELVSEIKTTPSGIFVVGGGRKDRKKYHHYQYSTKIRTHLGWYYKTRHEYLR
ncbi:MAG: hypothetical protein Q7S61_05690 [bacterium]|nr:hypothetical protein [bacterium]